MTKTSCRVNKIEVAKWKDSTLYLIYYLNGNGPKDRVLVWYHQNRHNRLKELLNSFCAPIQKIESALVQQVPTQFFPHELNFTHIDFISDKYCFDKVLKHYKGKDGQDNERVTDTQLHF